MIRRLAAWLRARNRFRRAADSARTTAATGREAERAAAAFLRKSGYRILARNARTPTGEVDIICRERASGVIVLVEVKGTASPTATAGMVERHLSSPQRARLLNTARSLQRRDRANTPVRIDVVTVLLRENSRPEIRHHRAAVRS